MGPWPMDKLAAGMGRGGMEGTASRSTVEAGRAGRRDRLEGSAGRAAPETSLMRRTSRPQPRSRARHPRPSDCAAERAADGAHPGPRDHGPAARPAAVRRDRLPQCVREREWCAREAAGAGEAEEGGRPKVGAGGAFEVQPSRGNGARVRGRRASTMHGRRGCSLSASTPSCRRPRRVASPFARAPSDRSSARCRRRHAGKGCACAGRRAGARGQGGGLARRSGATGRSAAGRRPWQRRSARVQAARRDVCRPSARRESLGARRDSSARRGAACAGGLGAHGKEPRARGAPGQA